MRMSGKGAEKLMETEPGGHRWQEPSGKKGQIHTSTVTVAVLPEQAVPTVKLDMRDVRVDFYRASGSGGQKKNKTDSACRVTHLPTDTVSRSENERSQHVNRELALAALETKLQHRANKEAAGSRAAKRKQQVGAGARGDKVRTVQFQNGLVVDPCMDKKSKIKPYLKGDLSWLLS